MTTKDQQYWLDHGFVLELLKQLPSYIFWKNTDCIYLGCNDAFAHAVGLSSPQEIIGKSDFDLPTTKQASAAYQADDKEVMRSGKPRFNIEEPQTFVDGRKEVLLTNKVPFRDKNGKVIGILGIYTNITELKQAQFALKEQIVKTEQAYHSKTVFLSMASHEIRSPISNVISILDLLKQQVDQLHDLVDEKTNKNLDQVRETNAKIAEYYEETKAEAYRALNALINLGDLHRLQIEGVKCRLEEYAVLDLIENAIKNSTYPNNRKVDIRLNIQPTVPQEAILDWRNVLEALRVVVGNAIRFSQINSTVNINAQTIKKEKQAFIEIVVQDQGVGISSTQLEHIFETALDKEKTETMLFRKPSLQLPQTKMRIEAAGGSLRIESKPDKGTIVTLLVPYEITSGVSLNPMTKEASSQQYMLLIEDDLLAQRFEKQCLEKLGHRVDIAATGADAIKMATTNQYDIIWLDITLPDMNGVDVMQKIQEKNGDDTPFVAITSHASEDNIDYFISKGIMTVLTKPVTERQFKDCIEDVLAAKKAENDD